MGGGEGREAQQGLTVGGGGPGRLRTPQQRCIANSPLPNAPPSPLPPQNAPTAPTALPGPLPTTSPPTQNTLTTPPTPPKRSLISFTPPQHLCVPLRPPFPPPTPPPRLGTPPNAPITPYAPPSRGPKRPSGPPAVPPHLPPPGRSPRALPGRRRRFADGRQRLTGLLPLGVLMRGALQAALPGSSGRYRVLRGPAERNGQARSSPAAPRPPARPRSPLGRTLVPEIGGHGGGPAFPKWRQRPLRHFPLRLPASTSGMRFR